MASGNGTNFGASIVATPAKSHEQNTLDSPALTPAVSRDDYDAYPDRRIPPHSPFYQHPPASFERVHSRQPSQNAHLNEKDRDLEAGASEPLTTPAADHDNPFTSKVNVDASKECRMWPSKQTLMQSRREEKKKRRADMWCGGCGPVRDWWSGFTKRQRLYMKIAFALLIIGVIVAIAVGISVAVNGTFYVTDDRSEQIPDPNQSN